MTLKKTVSIINDAYGYPIIGEAEEKALQNNRDVILSELGIGAIFEFLSYDVSEYSEARRTIHARRFYQIFHDIFSFRGFNMEAFHKIQAGCLFVVAMSGITRGIDEYEYAGFVRDALETIGRITPGDESVPTLNEKLFYIQSAFEKLSHISLGIYSLQIFTKYGMAIQKINSVHEGMAGRLFYEIAEDLKSGDNPSEKIDLLLSLGVTSPEELDTILGDYINYSIADISVQNLSHGKKKIEKANKKLAAEITMDVQDALSGLRMDVTGLYNMNRGIREKKAIYDKDPSNPDIYMMFLSLLDRYAALYERLWYYEGNTFIRRLNMIFIDRVKEMFAAQRKYESINVRNECIRIIEDGMEGLTVFELEGFMNGLQFGGDEFNLRNGLEKETSKRILSELNMYLDANIKTIREIRADMKNNLSRILGTEGIPEGERKILQETVYGFNAILELLTED